MYLFCALFVSPSPGYDIDPNVVLLEERSQNTLENAYFSKSLLYQQGITSVLIFTFLF